MANTPDLWRGSDRSPASLNLWRPLLRQLDDMLNLPGLTDDQRSFIPALDVEEAKDKYIIRVDMPGLSSEDIDIEVTGNQLQISGERKQEVDRTKGRSHVVERRYGRFERILTLPEGINPQRVDAEYRDGVLTVVIPKAEGSGSRKVKIGEGRSDASQRSLSGENQGEQMSSKGQQTASDQQTSGRTQGAQSDTKSTSAGSTSTGSTGAGSTRQGTATH